MLERGPAVTEPLLEAEQRFLGPGHQEVSRDEIDFALQGMPARIFAVHTFRAPDGRCSSWVGTTISGARARLSSFFVQQGLFGSVDHVLLTGFADDGAVVTERISR